MAHAFSLAGSRILLVEDELFLAGYISQAVAAAGGAILGPAHVVTEALDLLERELPDAATLNVRLRDERSFQVADKLIEKRIPFVILSAEAVSLPVRLSHIPFLQKPFAGYQVVEELDRLLGRRSLGGMVRGH